MSNRNDDLVAELRDARLKERAAFREMLDARQALRDRQAEHQDRLRLVEEILKEIETGSTGRPILDRITENGNGKAHDEVIDGGAIDLADGDAPMVTVDEVNDRLLTSIAGKDVDRTHWKILARDGASDDEIVEALRHAWPTGQSIRRQGKVSVRGGPSPAFWASGHRSERDIPTLAGPNLIRRIRELMDIPPPRPSAVIPPADVEALPDGSPPLGSRENPIRMSDEELKAIDRGLVEKIERGELMGGVRAMIPQTEGDALAMALAPVATKLRVLAKAEATDQAILHVLYDLPTQRNAHPAGKGVSWATFGGLAPGIWIGDEVRSWPTAAPGELHGTKLAAAVRKAYRIPEPKAAPGYADGCGPEWRSADLEAKLREALGWQGLTSRLPSHEKPPTTLEIVADLGDAWRNVKPAQCHGYRVRGGASPAFWMGEDNRRKPTLEGTALVDRVRRVLKLEWRDVGSATPEKPSRKSSKGRKPAEAASS